MVVYNCRQADRRHFLCAPQEIVAEHNIAEIWDEEAARRDLLKPVPNAAAAAAAVHGGSFPPGYALPPGYMPYGPQFNGGQMMPGQPGMQMQGAPDRLFCCFVVC